MSARLRLQRADGRIYLDRWGFEWKRLGGIFLHKMEAPDPGVDLHDHPWWFVSIILKGGYTERRNTTVRECLVWCQEATQRTLGAPDNVRNWLSIKPFRLDECHRITQLQKNRPCWTLIVHGPVRRQPWGFYTPSGWMAWRDYEESPAGKRRELSVPISSNDPDGSRP